MAKKTTTKRVRKAATIALGDDVRVAIYTRRSTDEENQPYSIDAQETRMRSYIDSQPGWRIVKHYTDNASGASTEREDLQKAMRAARAGLFDVLLVYRVDRFSRKLRDMVDLLDELDEAGVVFRSATEPFDTSTPMGRMLVQMLGMFAEFERETIIDRVIAGMERKAAKGRWKGGMRPFGYHVDQVAQQLIRAENEAPVVEQIFRLYVVDRLGANTIADTLNQRGHRTATGNLWARTQVVRILNNRAYLGELTFRDITVTNTHTPLISEELFDQAQQILETRGESHAHRATNSSDYLATGRINCPRCDKPMIGTRATGRHQTYRYYTCWNLNRYGKAKCDYARINADALDAAILEAVAAFYRSQHDLITNAVLAAQETLDASQSTHLAELATIDADLTKTANKIDKYLDAFEDGKLDPDDVKDRLTSLRDKRTQLRARREALADLIGNRPTAPDPATLDQVTRYIAEVITTGSVTQRKALVETLVHRIKVIAPDKVVPVFRIPQPHTSSDDERAETDLAPTPSPAVRVMDTVVGRLGLEPRTYGLKVGK